MFSHAIKISFVLILVIATIFGNIQARYVHPVTYGYSVFLPQDDLAVSASDSRTVIAQLVNNPATQHVVAPVSADSDILVSDASARVEKILRKPISFSYNTDQDHQASSQAAKKSRSRNSQAKLDQQPDAVDYYKYLARLEKEEKGGAAQQKDKGDSGAKFLLDYNAAKPVGFHKRNEKSKADIALDHNESRTVPLVKEDSEDDDNDSDESSSNSEDKADDHETSASEHKGDKGGGGGSYKKGGGKDDHTQHHDIHDQKGKKVYDGRHHNEKGDIGKHEKKGHDDHYTESGGHKEAKHQEDEYHAEHEHGEEGKQGADFHEEGEHSKGHSTSGEHNIHKKDEYEKKQEFYDESHEGGDNEKHGEYFHEDGFEKVNKQNN